MRSNPEHMAQLEKLGVTPIDIVAINLYPFKQTVLKPGVEARRGYRKHRYRRSDDASRRG